MNEIQPPRIGVEQINLLQKLCNAAAVSGGEGEVRKIVLDYLKENTSSEETGIHQDALGNVLVTRRGNSADALRVMVAAHMDEVGFMLSSDEDDGLFRFELVGGIDPRQLAGKPVWIGREHIPGVIGAKPIHLTTAEERKNNLTLDALRIDVGPGNSSKVKVGDRATFATTFTRIGPSIRAKALDNRLGVATLLELVRWSPPQIHLQAAFTVQEEVGLRGARVAAYQLDPQVAIALDSTPAVDLPGWDGQENTQYRTRLGAGPAIYVADASTLSDPRLFRHFVETAENAGIPYQVRQPGGGSTDAGAIHLQRAGIPSLSISIPGRYPHTAAGLARIDDWENTLALMVTALSRLTPDLWATERM